MSFLLFILFCSWLGWASCSTGGLHELKHLNPDYAHPNRHVAYLVSKINWSESSGFWDSFHVESCSAYMSNWEKAERCVRARLSCELTAPTETDAFGTRPDVSSAVFRECWQSRRPPQGPVEWIRLSRGLFRGASVYLILRLMGADSDPDWDERNAWLANPLVDWMERAQ